MTDTLKEEAPADGRGMNDSALATLIIPALAVALTVYYMATTAGLTWEARSTGWLIGSVLLVFCGIQMLLTVRELLAGKIRAGFGDLFENSQNNRRRVGLLVAVSIFTLLLPFTGTTLGLALVICAGMLIMGVRSPWQLAGVSLTTATFVFVLLIWLAGSRLPQGALEHALLSILP